MLLGHRVTISLPDKEAFARKGQEAIPFFSPDQCAYLPIPAGGGAALLKGAAAAMQACGAKEVFFACLDEVASSMFRRAAFGLTPPSQLRGAISGIYIRPRALDHRRGNIWSLNLWLKRRGLHLLDQQGWLKRILILDERISVATSYNSMKTKLFFMPEPGAPRPLESAPDESQAKEKLRIPHDKFVFLQYGVGDKRKGLNLVIDVWNKLPADSKAFLLCAGRIDPSLAPALRQLEAAGKARIIDRYVTSQEERLCFVATDVVLAAYVNHYGSSNVLAKAAAFGRPVLASDNDLVGYRVRKYGLGRLCLHNNLPSLMDAVLAMSIEDPNSLRQDYAKQLAAFAKLGSPEMIAACLAGRPVQAEAAESIRS